MLSFREVFGADKVEEDLSIEEKVNKIGLSFERVGFIKHSPVKQLPIDSTDYKKTIENIDTDKILGTTRNVGVHVLSWYDMLDKVCHKDYIFRKFDLGRFDDLLLNPRDDDHPVVIENNGAFYIEDNGMHRLSIAKCQGGKKAKVIVKKPNQ